MGQAFRRPGSQEVTLVKMTDHLLAPEEAFAGRQLRDAFEAEGITGKYQAQVLGDILGGRNGEEWPATGAWADDRDIW